MTLRKERKGYSHLKEEALDRTMWRARFGRGFGPVVRQTTKRMDVNKYIIICDGGRSIQWCFPISLHHLFHFKILQILI